MAKINTLNYQTVASWNGSQDLFIVEQLDGTKVATPAMVKQFIEAGDFVATGEVKDGHGNILNDLAGQVSQLIDGIATKINKTAIQSGKDKFIPAAVGVQTVTVTFPTAFTHVPEVMVTWDDNQALPTFFKYPLHIAEITTTGFKVQAERINASSNWWFRYIAVDNQ